MFEIDKSRLSDEITKLSNNFEYHRIKYMGEESDAVNVTSRDIHIFPFETETTGKVMTGVYVTKRADLITGEQTHRLIHNEFDGHRDESDLDTVLRWFADNMKLNIGDDAIKRMFYIGEIELSGRVNYKTPCYAINVTGMFGARPPKNFVISEETGYSVELVAYNALIREVPVCGMIAAATLLMLTYMETEK